MQDIKTFIAAAQAFQNLNLDIKIRKITTIRNKIFIYCEDYVTEYVYDPTDGTLKKA